MCEGSKEHRGPYQGHGGDEKGRLLWLKHRWKRVGGLEAHALPSMDQNQQGWKLRTVKGPFLDWSSCLVELVLSLPSLTSVRPVLLDKRHCGDYGNWETSTILIFTNIWSRQSFKNNKISAVALATRTTIVICNSCLWRSTALHVFF